MNKIAAIIKKELSSYFKTPIAYILLVIAMVVFNIFFYVIIEENREATLRDVFKIMEFMFIFMIPILTMKVYSEERMSGTLEFLLTAPIKHSTIILGKYLGSLAFFTLLVALTGIYYLIIAVFGQPDHAAILTGYLGVWLEGALFIAIGLLCSSWTKNQIISAMCSYLFIFLLYFSLSFIQYTAETWEDLVRHISVTAHTENLFAGIITFVDLMYFISAIGVCLVLTNLSLQKQ